MLILPSSFVISIFRSFNQTIWLFLTMSHHFLLYMNISNRSPNIHKPSYDLLWTVSDYPVLLSDYLRLYLTILDCFGLSQIISDYSRLSQDYPCLSLTHSDYLLTISDIGTENVLWPSSKCYFYKAGLHNSADMKQYLHCKKI